MRGLCLLLLLGCDAELGDPPRAEVEVAPPLDGDVAPALEAGLDAAAVDARIRLDAPAPMDAAPLRPDVPAPTGRAYTLCARDTPCMDDALVCVAIQGRPGAWCAPRCQGECAPHPGGPAECLTLGGRRVCAARCDLASLNSPEGCPGDLICRDVGEALGFCAPG